MITFSGTKKHPSDLNQRSRMTLRPLKSPTKAPAPDPNTALPLVAQNRPELLHDALDRFHQGKVKDSSEILFFLKLGANPNTVDRDGTPALNKTLLAKNANSFRLLFNRDVNLHMEDAKGKDAFTTAVDTHNIKAARLILEDPRLDRNKLSTKLNALRANQKAYMHQFVLQKKQSMVDLMLDAKANPDIQTQTGECPLHYAVAVQSPGIVQSLLQAKARVDIQNKNLETPLHWNTKFQCLEITKQLLKAKANPHSPNKNNKTPRDYAMATPLLEIFPQC